MRVHTSLTYGDMAGLIGPGQRFGGRPLPVRWHSLTAHGSRSHPYAYEIRLEGSGGLTNSGQWGAGDFYGATWDEWGAMFGRLFTLDPDARCGGTVARPHYGGAADYHWQTGDRFRSGQIPADTHPRHRWVIRGEWSHGAPVHEYDCAHKSGCTAVWRVAHRHTYADLVTLGLAPEAGTGVAYWPTADELTGGRS